MAWVVGVEVPEELADQDVQVFQSEDDVLEEDQVRELRWPLIDPLGSVFVRWTDVVGVEGNRSFESGEHRLFKIAKSGANGRAVSRVTRGHYLVIAAHTLTRAQASEGTAPVAPENVIPEVSGILAHHLLTRAETDVLVLGRSGTGTVEVRPSASAAYKLIGTRIEDAHEVAGPLFGREPPRLRVEGAEEPAQVVVGVEGASPRRRPRQTAASFDDMRNWFDEHEPDWFFVRLYDANDDLLDSLDFRYAKGLEAIEIDEHSSLPDPCGHRPARVDFHLTSGMTISPVDGPPEITSFRKTPAEGILLPARSDAGQAMWRLRAENGGGVEVVVRVPRVWWAFTAEENPDESPPWTDRPQRLATEHFQPTSSTLFSVLLPARGWADEILIGFRDGSRKSTRVMRSEHTVQYPLRNLGQDDALLSHGQCDLLMWVRSGTGEEGPVTVGEVRLLRDQPHEHEARRSLDLSLLSTPRLMSVITRLGWLGLAQDRRAARRLRALYYQRARKGGPAERREFLFQGLALVAALVEQESTTPGLPARWRQRAALLAATQPTAVAVWKRHLRQAAPSGRVRARNLAGTGDGSA